MKGFHTHTKEEELKAKSNPNVIFGGRDHNGNAFFGYTSLEKLLSQGEKEVYALKEMSDEIISKKLKISEKTVKAYRKKIKNKL